MTQLNTEKKNHEHVGAWEPDSNTHKHTHTHGTVGLLNSTRKSHNPAPGLREKREMGKMKGGEVPSFQLSTDTYSKVWEATLCALSSRLMNVIT